MNPENNQNKIFSFRSFILLIVILFLAIGGGYLGAEISNRNHQVVIKENITNQNSSVSTTNGQIQETIKNVSDAVVEIRTEKESNNVFLQQFVTEGAGSGVILTDDGYIITNNHVIDGASKITVTLADDQIYSATLIGADQKSDLAVIKIEAKDLHTVTLGDSESLEVGDTVIAIGNPLGSLGGSVSKGIISALNREITVGNESMNLLQTDTAVNPGNSGGGLFDINGNLIGIVNAKSEGTDIEGIGFAIPINEAKDIVTQLINVGYVSNRATLGITVSELQQSTENYDKGLYVVDVIADSAAEKAGIKPYDQIVFFNDVEIETYNDLSKELKNHQINDEIKLTIVRDGKKITVNLTLQEAVNPANK